MDDIKKTSKIQDLSNNVKTYYFYTQPDLSGSKNEIIDSILGQIKENPNFSLGEYPSEEKLKTDLMRKVFGETDPNKLTDITPHIEEISEIMETVFQDSFDILPSKSKEDITVYILPFCNEESSKDLDGVNGSPVEENILYLLIDITNPNWKKSLKETVPHEYAHLVYTSDYEWNSILDGIVNEGFAEHFRIHVVGGDIAPWSAALPKEKALEELSNIPEERLNLFIEDSNADLYISYFFGTKDLPNWYGYSLGYWMIDEILEKTDYELIELFQKSPKEIFQIFNQ